MTDQEIEKITVTIANEFLNSFNLNGLVAAAKHYSIHLAKEKVDSLEEADLKKIMSEILEREKELAEKGETSEARVTTSVNPEAQ